LTYRKLFAGVLVASLAWAIGQAIAAIVSSWTVIMTMYWMLS
jgi:hypothetical protein